MVVLSVILDPSDAGRCRCCPWRGGDVFEPPPHTMYNSQLNLSIFALEDIIFAIQW